MTILIRLCTCQRARLHAPRWRPLRALAASSYLKMKMDTVSTLSRQTGGISRNGKLPSQCPEYSYRQLEDQVSLRRACRG